MARDDGGYGNGWYGGGYAQPQYGLPRAQNYFYQRRWW